MPRIGESLVIPFTIGEGEPAPVFSSVANPSPVITYKFTDLFRFQTIAELPIYDTTFSLAVNGAGPWQSTLEVEDSEVRKTNWRAQ